MLRLHVASTWTSTRICRTGFSRRSCPMSWLRFLDTAAPKAKAKAKVKAKSKAKAKAAGKAKAAASKAPGVTSSPMKAQKAKAKSTMKLPQGKEMCQNDQRWPGARRPSAALWRGLQEFSWTPDASLCLLLEIPSVRSFQEELWDLQQISDYWVGLGCGQNPGNPASFEWCRKTRWCLSERWLLSCQDNSHSHCALPWFCMVAKPTSPFTNPLT